jgi:sarcosine oxidase, subunit beta
LEEKEMMIEKADVAIIGGGIIGAATAFYLARDTKLSVVLFERKGIGSGSTGMSSGVVRHYYATDLLVKSAIRSRKIYETFEKSVGEPLEYVSNGFISIDYGEVAKSAPGMVADLRRNGLDAEVLDTDQIKNGFPFLKVSDDEIASLDREAGYVPNPGDAARIYARQAAKHGAKVYESSPITGVGVKGKAVASVRLERGEVSVSYVVNASGPWAREVGSMVGLDIPVQSERQQLVDLRSPDGWPLNRPTISDRRYYTYIRPRKNGIALVGGHYYAQKCNPSDFKLSADTEFFEDVIPRVVARAPVLENATIAAGYSGLYETTADRYPLVGESEEVGGFITAAGWSGHGFKHGPACGMLLKELIETGSPSLDLSILRPERFKNGTPVDTPYARVNAPYG